MSTYIYDDKIQAEKEFRLLRQATAEQRAEAWHDIAHEFILGYRDEYLESIEDETKRALADLCLCEIYGDCINEH